MIKLYRSKDLGKISPNHIILVEITISKVEMQILRNATVARWRN